MHRKQTRTRRGAGLLLLCLLLALSLSAQIVTLPAAAAEPAAGSAFTYEHDPRLNPKAMEDIKVDPTAVYGFSPTAEGGLKEYAVGFDWTDPAAVEAGRQERIGYHKSLQSMYDMLKQMQAEGKSMEEIARAVSAERNALRIAAYADDPEGLATMKARNLERYGREEGPTPDEMYQKYGSWDAVIEKAFSPNVGMDVCLGLYDEYYSNYQALGLLYDESVQTATREYAVASLVRAAGRSRFEGEGPSLSSFRDADRVGVWYRDDLAAAVACGVLRGYDDGTLRPGDGITRIEAFALLSRCLPDLEPVTAPLIFSDTPAWARDEIDRLSAAGLVKGYGDGTLGAGDQLTVEQVGILVGRLAGMLYAGS